MVKSPIEHKTEGATIFAGGGAAMMKNGGNTENYEIGDRLVDGGRLTFVPGKSRKILHVSRINYSINLGQ